MTIIDRNVYLPMQQHPSYKNFSVPSDDSRAARKNAASFALNLINVKSLNTKQVSEVNFTGVNRATSFEKTPLVAANQTFDGPRTSSMITPNLSNIKIQAAGNKSLKSVVKHKRSQKGIIVGNALILSS